MANPIIEKFVWANFFEKNSKKILITISVITVVSVVAAGSFWYYYQSVNKDVLAIVGNDKIRVADLTGAIRGLSLGTVGTDESPEVVSEELRTQLLNDLVEAKILEAKAKELNIKLDDGEIDDYAVKINSGFPKLADSQKKYIRENARLEVLRTKVQEKVLSWSAGKVILARFDLHFNTEPSLKTTTERASLVASERDYAKNLINDIYAKISDGQMTFEAGMDMTNSDPVIGKAAWGDWDVTFSKSFTKDESLSHSFLRTSSDFWEKVGKIEPGEVGKPTLIKVYPEEGAVVDDQADGVDGIYMIVKKEAGNTGVDKGYEQWLDSEKTRLGLVVY